MKISGRNLKRRMFKMSIIGNRLSRLKHFRGHGVHSPYVYGLVRKVLMHNTLAPDTEHPLYTALSSRGISQRRAIELQNLAYYTSSASFSIDCTECTSDINILTADIRAEELDTAAKNAAQSGTTLVVLAPYLNRSRRNACSELIWKHHSTTVDNRGYIIFFNNHLPKQHYKL